MRMRIWSALCVAGLLLGFTSTASAAGVVASVKLLAPNVGWAMSMRRLLWTRNGGASWKDITPPAPSDLTTSETPDDVGISTVFFLDTNRGWVLLAHGEPDVPGGLKFDLASTNNAGDSWSIRHT